MNISQIKYIVEVVSDPNINKYKPKPASSHTYGFTHPFWKILNIKIPPELPWKSLTGAERTQIVRAANTLQANNIPYIFYADFIVFTGKSYLKRRSPLSITKIKTKENGDFSLLSEYIAMIRILVNMYKEDDRIIRINEKVLSRFKKEMVSSKLCIHSVSLIKDALKHQSPVSIMGILSECTSAMEFFNRIGGEISKPNFSVSDGIRCTDKVKLLRQEQLVRIGKKPGIPNKEMDKYFKKGNKLSSRGLKILSGNSNV